jgi:hypothetical protein
MFRSPADAGYGLIRTKVGQLFNLIGRAAKTGTVQEVRRRRIIPLVR